MKLAWLAFALALSSALPASSRPFGYTSGTQVDEIESALLAMEKDPKNGLALLAKAVNPDNARVVLEYLPQWWPLIPAARRAEMLESVDRAAMGRDPQPLVWLAQNESGPLAQEAARRLKNRLWRCSPEQWDSLWRQGQASLDDLLDAMKSGLAWQQREKPGSLGQAGLDILNAGMNSPSLSTRAKAARALAVHPSEAARELLRQRASQVKLRDEPETWLALAKQHDEGAWASGLEQALAWDFEAGYAGQASQAYAWGEAYGPGHNSQAWDYFMQARERPESALMQHYFDGATWQADEALAARWREARHDAHLATRVLARQGSFEARRRNSYALDKAWDRLVDSGLLLLFCLFATLSGLLVFAMAFRLWRLKAALQSLGISPSPGVAQGLSRVRGRAVPAGGQGLKPDGGERMVWAPGVPGAEQVSFYVCDDKGRVEVWPQGAALLGGDGVIKPGELIQVVGRASSTQDPESGEVLRHIGRERPRGWLARLGQLASANALLRGVFGLGERGQAAALLFQNPRDAFMIWEDQTPDPAQGESLGWARQLTLLVSGAWATLFFLLSAALAWSRFHPAQENVFQALLGLLN